MLNIINLNDGNVMLGCDVASIREANEYLAYYKRRYAPGTPYDNGKGFYDTLFVPVRRCECCGEYSTLH